MTLLACDLPLRLAAVSPRLYHLTDAENLQAVLAAGLRPDRPSQFTRGLLRPGCLYFCNLFTAQAALHGELDVNWGDAVLSVDPRSLEPGRLRADEDYYRGEMRGRNLGFLAADIVRAYPALDAPESLLESFGDGGSLAYAGPIPARWLRLELLPPRPDLPAIEPLRGPLHAAAHYGQRLSDREFLRQLAKQWRVKVGDF